MSGSVVTPVQAAGSAVGRAGLVPAAATRAWSAPGDGEWRAEVAVPEDAVPREDRSGPRAVPVDGEAWRGLPPGVARADAADAAAALPAAPSITAAYPPHGYLVDSLRPVLRARASGSGSISYSFKVCKVASMSGATCSTSGFLSGGVSAWTVPANALTWGEQYYWTVTARTSSFESSTSPVRSFVTGVRQPVVASLYARGGLEEREFHPQSGNYTTTFTDLVVAAAGPALAVVRTYNSLDARTGGMFGAGWSTRWDMRVVKEVRGAVVSAVVTYPDGRLVRFRGNGDGTFQPPPGMYATLAEESGGWRLMDKAATVYLFDTAGKLTQITDERQRTQTLTYDGGRRLTQVSGAGGRSVHFTWTGGHVTAVSSDPVGGSPVTWTYGYDGDRLVQVCAPVAAPNCTTFAYSLIAIFLNIIKL